MHVHLNVKMKDKDYNDTSVTFIFTHQRLSQVFQGTELTLNIFQG